MMSKSLITHLRGYADALFKDIAFAYRRPKEMERDKARLLHELEFHGLRIVTLDLPALAKHFDRCLDEGQYSPSGLCLGRVGSEGVPLFLRDLFLQIFNRGGSLKDDPSIDVVAVVRQLLLGLKKLRVPYLRSGLRNGIKDFIATERDCRPYTLNWGNDDRLSSDHQSVCFADWCSGDTVTPDVIRDVGYLSAVADRISASFGYFNPLDWSPEVLPRHGPGVVSDLSKKESKYSFKDWPDKLDRVFPYDLFASRNLGYERLEDRKLSYRNREVPSKMIAVPYDMSKPRLIACEPSQHQWIQQLVRSQLEASLKHTSLRHSVFFEDQTRNQDAAKKGSVDGSLATIDLSSASDRLTCAVVERFFRKNPTILDSLHASRTRWLKIEIPGREVTHHMLRKFAPMGSSVTFPVQSIVYAGIAIAAILSTESRRVTTASIEEAAKRVRVFGDDIVIPTHCCRSLISLLTFAGLKVNTNKTFMKGNFRESCGVEAFKGYDVSIARILDLPDDASPGTISSFVSQANNLFRKGYWNLSKWMESSFSKYRKFIPILEDGSGAFGLTSFSGEFVGHLSSRWNDALHRKEYRVLVPKVTDTILEASGDLNLFQRFVENPPPDVLKEYGTRFKSVAYMRQGWSSPWNILA